MFSDLVVTKSEAMSRRCLDGLRKTTMILIQDIRCPVRYLPTRTSSANRLTFRHRASCILGQAFHYSPENAFYVFNQQIYFIICYLLDRASLM